MGSLRILIADDHEVVRRGLRSLLATRRDWEICGEAVDGRDAVQKARGLKPDLVMLDISMPYLNGLDAARIIRKESPQSEILILSQHESSEVVRAALEAERSKIPVKLELAPDLGRLPRELETTVFRMIQECLTNVHRHSESKTAEIVIARSAREVTVEVRDQGKGMSLDAQGKSGRPVTPGVGLQGMRERVRQLGGKLEIESANGRGTIVRASLPVGSVFSDSVEETLGAAS